MKIKKIFLLTVCFFIFKWSSGQTDSLSFQKHHFVFSISAGMAMPIGEFAQYQNTAPNNNPYNIAGFAENGFNAKIQVTYLWKKIGIIASYIHTENKAGTPDADSLLSPPYYWPGGYETTTETYYTTKTWYTNSVLVGVILPIIKTKRISLDLKMAGGFQQAISPETELDTQNKTVYGIDSSNVHFITTNYKTIQPQLTSKNFVFDSGIDFNYHVTKKLSAVINIDCLLTHVTQN